MRRRVVALLLGAVLVLAGLNAALNRGICAYYGYQTDRATRYAAFVGCMVKVDAAWIPRNELRVVQ